MIGLQSQIMWNHDSQKSLNTTSILVVTNCPLSLENYHVSLKNCKSTIVIDLHILLPTQDHCMGFICQYYKKILEHASNHSLQVIVWIEIKMLTTIWKGKGVGGGDIIHVRSTILIRGGFESCGLVLNNDLKVH